MKYGVITTPINDTRKLGPIVTTKFINKAKVIRLEVFRLVRSWIKSEVNKYIRKCTSQNSIGSFLKQIR